MFASPLRAASPPATQAPKPQSQAAFLQEKKIDYLNLHKELKSHLEAEDPFADKKLSHIEKLDNKLKLAIQKLDHETQGYLLRVFKYGTDLQLAAALKRELAQLYRNNPSLELEGVLETNIDIESELKQAEDDALTKGIELSLTSTRNDTRQVSSWHKGLAQVFEHFLADCQLPPSNIPEHSIPSTSSATTSETASISENNQSQSSAQSSVNPNWEKNSTATSLIEAQLEEDKKANKELRNHIEKIGYTTQPNFGSSDKLEVLNNCLIRALMQAALPYDTPKDDLEEKVIWTRNAFNKQFGAESATQRLLFNETTVSSIISLINDQLKVNLQAAVIEAMPLELAAEAPYTISSVYAGKSSVGAPSRHAILFAHGRHFELIVPKPNITQSV